MTVADTEMAGEPADAKPETVAIPVEWMGRRACTFHALIAGKSITLAAHPDVHHNPENHSGKAWVTTPEGWPGESWGWRFTFSVAALKEAVAAALDGDTGHIPIVADEQHAFHIMDYPAGSHHRSTMTVTLLPWNRTSTPALKFKPSVRCEAYEVHVSDIEHLIAEADRAAQA